MLTVGVWVIALALVVLVVVVVVVVAVGNRFRATPSPDGAAAAVAPGAAGPGRRLPHTPAPRRGPASAPAGTTTTTARRTPTDPLEALAPDGLPRFADVGGFETLKAELRTTVQLMLDPHGVAEQYRIEWNGVLLHGPPGVGKTLLARATAGELGLHFVYVSTADAVSKWIGEAPGRVDHAFTFGAQHTPCLLFFDEFDSLAAHRDGDQHLEYRRLTNQLLASLEEHHGTDGLVVMAATNAYEQLDPAVIRPGRFDRHIRIGLPDVEARRAIFGVHLRGRPLAGDVNVDDLALLTDGCSGAAIEAAIEAAAVETAGKALKVGSTVPIGQAALVAHLEPFVAS